MLNSLSRKIIKNSYLLVILFIGSTWPMCSHSSSVLDNQAIKAIKKNDWDYLKKQINSGLDINSHDSFGFTLLHRAIGRRKSKTFVSYLIENGANINAESKNGFTPILSALQAKDTNAFDMLIKAKANIKGDVNGNSALHYAAQDRVNSIRTIPLLIRLGANAKTINERKETPLHVLMTNYLPAKDYLTLLKLFIKQGVDLNQQNLSGETIVLMALKISTYKDTIDLLLKHNVDVSLNSKTDSAITAAFQGEHIYTPMFGRLLKMGAKIDDSGLNGITPLHLLAKSRKDKTVTDLMITDFIKKGANLNVIDDKGNTPLMNAAEIGDLDRIKLLIKLGAKIEHRELFGPTVMQKANWTDNNKNIIKYLLNQGADINAVGHKNSNLLANSMNHGKPEDLSWIKYLLKKGANPNIFLVRQSPRTPYDWAVIANNAELQKLLVSYGAYMRIPE